MLYMRYYASLLLLVAAAACHGDVRTERVTCTYDDAGNAICDVVDECVIRAQCLPEERCLFPSRDAMTRQCIHTEDGWYIYWVRRT